MRKRIQNGSKRGPKRIQNGSKRDPKGLKTICLGESVHLEWPSEHLKPQGSCKSRARSAQIRSVRCAVPQNADFVVSSCLIGHPPNLSIDIHRMYLHSGHQKRFSNSRHRMSCETGTSEGLHLSLRLFATSILDSWTISNLFKSLFGAPSRFLHPGSHSEVLHRIALMSKSEN